MSLIKIYPITEDAKTLVHPAHTDPLNDEGCFLWPDDLFTKRRIKEGAVSTVDPASATAA